MTYNYSVVIENYLDEDPPLITNINFNKTTTTFFADITDFSDLSFVYLNLTAHNLTTGATEIALQNFTMNHYSGITYYNATSLDSLTGSFVNITYNIIAEDSIGYSTASPVRHFDLDDPEAPIVLSYNAVDYGNSSIRFVSNITDTSGIQSPVILQVDSEYYEMYQNGSGFWIYNGFFDYDVALDFTIFSVYDQVGNENGSNIQPLSFPFKSITPSDFTSPRISALSDSFSDHEQGYVEFDVNIDDWNMYQSGVNASSVDIILEINGFNITLNITQIGEITFSYEYTFNYNDSVNYWIKAMDFADNVVYSLKRGPFLINDNTIPNINFWANEYGNGTIDFFTTVNDWPNNDTIAFILFTGDYFATEWMNYSMTPLSESQFWYRYEDFPYQPQDVWYYGTAFDSANNTLETPLDSAKSISLTDSVAPTITLTLINSTINDGEVTVRARAIDKYGTQIFVNNTFYINISTSSGLFSGLMAYDPSFYPFSTYNHTFSYPYQEEITITVWVSDLYGNLGLINKTILIQDEAPPTIVDHGISDFQNGTIIIWVEVFEGINGSGLYADNTSVILIWAYINIFTVNMVWNGTGNYFWHKITDREPGDAITYNFTVIDNAGNIASIPLTLLIVSDTITPIFVVDPTVNEIQIDHITTEITFRTVVQDPFGYISYVLLEYAILEESGWTNFSSLLDLIGSEYSYKALFVPNSTLQFRMTVVDTMLNNVTSHYSNIRLADFDPASFDVAEYGIEPSSESGKVTIWASIDDPFDDHDTNVSISITDVTIGLLILNNVHMIPEGKNYTYLFPVEYLHNYSFTLTLVDLGVHYGYYPADVLLLTNTHMGDLWTPDILVAGYES
ncbi:MAG: hypothetical protein ACW98F_19220, partial [Candidatus Hodarchaeales archaeon]